MTKNSIARRYAQALFNLLDPSAIEPVNAVLCNLAKGLDESASFKHVVASPVFTVEEKNAVLAALSDRFHGPPVLRQFLSQLVKKNRAGLLPEISESFQRLADQQQGRQQVTVASSKPLDATEQERLRQQLGTVLHRKVDILFQADPSLLCGLQIRVGSKVYDSSLKGRLAKLHALMAEG